MVSLGFERIEEILLRASSVRAVVVGDVMLDIYLTGSVQRISPEAPVPVVQVLEERYALGGAANVAANIVGLGASCDLIGIIGRDSSGEAISRAAAAIEGGILRPRLLPVRDRPTTTKTRVMARRQQVVRYDREVDTEIAAETAAQVGALVRDVVPDADILVFEDYDKGVLTRDVIRTALDAARSAGVPVVVDPKFRNVAEYRDATVCKPNAAELAAAMGGPTRLDDDGWLEQARRRFGCEHLLVTVGEQGMILRSNDQTTFRVPAIAREVYDVSGAGDTVTAFVAVALAAGADIREATVIANIAAAVGVARPGVAVVSADDLRDVAARFHAESVLP
jgi:D-beta-D-heptose 7-phosphate kinase/D-beta-D-heptose 1-phosphate adenosyltransferase